MLLDGYAATPLSDLLQRPLAGESERGFHVVSIPSVATVALFLAGLMVIFGLGYQMGSARDFTARDQSAAPAAERCLDI